MTTTDRVLFLHGIGMTATGWAPQIAALADRFHCLTWEAPGYGDAPAPTGPVTFASLASDVAEAIGDAGAHLVGLSWGGQIALHTALDHPGCVASLALLDTSPAFGIDGTDPDAWRRLRLEPLDRGVSPAALAEPVLRSVMAPDVADGALAEAIASMARISPAGLRAAVECLPSHDVRTRLREIACPTLVIVGELDRETPPPYARLLADGIPNARLAIIPGAGHITNLEAPDAVNALLRDHLAA